MNTLVGCRFLFQKTCPTRGSDPHLLCLLYQQVDSLPLSHLGFSSFKNASGQHRLTAQSTEEGTANGIHLFSRQVGTEFEVPRSDDWVRTLDSFLCRLSEWGPSGFSTYSSPSLLTKQSLDCQLILTANPPVDWKNQYISWQPRGNRLVVSQLRSCQALPPRLRNNRGL